MLLKFSKFEEMYWNLEPRNFVAVEGIFLFSVVLRCKTDFWKCLGGVHSFWRLFCERKAAKKNYNSKHQTENQLRNQLKIPEMPTSRNLKSGDFFSDQHPPPPKNFFFDLDHLPPSPTEQFRGKNVDLSVRYFNWLNTHPIRLSLM